MSRPRNNSYVPRWVCDIAASKGLRVCCGGGGCSDSPALDFETLLPAEGPTPYIHEDWLGAIWIDSYPDGCETPDREMTRANSDHAAIARGIDFYIERAGAGMGFDAIELAEVVRAAGWCETCGGLK